jgi:lysophospholipase L1-like esterase
MTTSPTHEPGAGWSRWQKALVLALPLLLLFLAGEVAGRLLERYAGYLPRRSASYAEGNPFLRTALVPGIHFESGPFDVDVNRLGFRGPEIAVPKPPGTFRIFAIGESSTFGWKGASSHEEAWPAVLEAKLRAAHPERSIEVVNAGVPGYTSIEQRINYLLRISHLEPDAVLIYHGNNDLTWSWVPNIETNLVYGRGESVGPPGLLARAIDLSYVLMELRSRADLFGRANATKHDTPDTTAIRVLGDNLSGLIQDAKRSGVRVAISTFAHGFDEDGAPGVFSEDEVALGVPAVGRWFEYLDAQGARRSFPLYNEMIRHLARSEGIVFADARSRIPGTTEYFIDWCHFTRQGYALMADVWFEAIEEAGWFASEHPQEIGQSASAKAPATSS